MRVKRRGNHYNVFTYVSAALGLFTLLWLLSFLVITGTPALSSTLLTNDYYTTQETVTITREVSSAEFIKPEGIDSKVFSVKWGVAFTIGKDAEGEETYQISWVDKNSPLKKTKVLYKEEEMEIKVGTSFTTIIGLDEFGNQYVLIANKGLEQFTTGIDKMTDISQFAIITPGGGIRGSIITTLWVVLFGIVFATPIGIGAAIYLREFSAQNKIKKVMRSIIDTLTGVPSVIYGLVGAAIIIPISNKIFGGEGRTIIGGGLTMAIVIIPIIIKNTEEALIRVPKDQRRASYALGATRAQTTFKVVLPNTIAGILSGVILGIGRIIAESAALIVALGATVVDSPNPHSSGTTLAVHIYKVMAGDGIPKTEVAAAIGIIIITIVLILIILIKLIEKKLSVKY